MLNFIITHSSVLHSAAKNMFLFPSDGDSTGEYGQNVTSKRHYAKAQSSYLL